MKRFRIPNYDVKLDGVEVEVTHTRQFQRLFYIKQLGLAHLIYPAATHSRAYHSIECLFHADRILDSIEKQAGETVKKYRNDVRMAALLHDIGHVPFSHTLEDEHLVLSKHDGEQRLKTAIELLLEEVHSKEAKRRIQAAHDILRGLAVKKKGDSDRELNWKLDLVGNTICADLLAYITTDATWAGIEKRPGHYRIYDYFEVHDGGLCIRLTKNGVLRTDIVSAILDILDMRYALTERVLFHHAKCVASAMLARAARLCKLAEDEQLLKMGDEAFLDYLENRAHNVEPQEDGEGARNILKNLRSRKLYQRLYKLSPSSKDIWNQERQPGAFSKKWRDPVHVEEALCRIEKKTNLPRGSLALWCHDKTAGMKAAAANVVWENIDGVQGPYPLNTKRFEELYPSLFSRVRTVEKQYEDLWCFWIGLDRCYFDQAGSVLAAIEQEVGLDCDSNFRRYLEGRFDNVRTGYESIRNVNEVLLGLGPDIAQNLEDSASADGNDKSYNRADILAAAYARIMEEGQSTPDDLLGELPDDE